MRGTDRPRLTPMGVDYETVGTFYATLGHNLNAFVERVGEREAFCGDPALQLSPAEVELGGARPVRCLTTALAAFSAIVRQGEGAPQDAADSHFQRFLAIRSELARFEADDATVVPALPAGVNPVLRRPMRPQGRIFLQDERAAQVVDLANAG